MTPPAAPWLAVLLGIAVTLSVRGYRYGESNHAVYLIDALRRVDPTLLKNDWWTNQTLQYHFVFNTVSGWLMKLGAIEPGVPDRVPGTGRAAARGLVPTRGRGRRRRRSVRAVGAAVLLVGGWAGAGVVSLPAGQRVPAEQCVERGNAVGNPLLGDGTMDYRWRCDRVGGVVSHQLCGDGDRGMVRVEPVGTRAACSARGAGVPPAILQDNAGETPARCAETRYSANNGFSAHSPSLSFPSPPSPQP